MHVSEVCNIGFCDVGSLHLLLKLLIDRLEELKVWSKSRELFIYQILNDIIRSNYARNRIHLKKLRYILLDICIRSYNGKNFDAFFYFTKISSPLLKITYWLVNQSIVIGTNIFKTWTFDEEKAFLKG